MTTDRLIAGRYRLTDPIGSGAMGVVWRGEDVRLRRTVAVKQVLIAPGLSKTGALEAKVRAMREGRIAARLHHPNAITVFDVADEDGQPWLVMEFMDAPSLAAKMSGLSGAGRLEPTEVARIGAQAAAALVAAHEAGIVHRDVKPANLLVGADGTVKITDFGISRAVGDVTVTATGFLAGTPAYLAPEIARGEEPAAASDVFALGSTLYAAVEGTPPFGEGDNPLAVLHAVARAQMRPPQRAGALAGVLMWLLAATVDERPTMRDAQAALEAVAAGRSPAVPRPATSVLSTASVGAAAAGLAPDSPGSDAESVAATTGAGPSGAGASVLAPTASRSTTPGLGQRLPHWAVLGVAVLGVTLLAVVILLVVVLNRSGSEAAVAAAPSAMMNPSPANGPVDPQPVTQPPGLAEPATRSNADISVNPTTSAGTSSPAPSVSSTSSARPTPSISPTPSTKPAPPSSTAPPRPLTEDRIGEFVRGYYAMLPGATSGAWSQLSPGYQAQTGGYAQYSDFWSTIDSVRVNGVRASGDDAVIADLTYVGSNGVVSRESRWIQVAATDGDLRITASSA